MKMMITIGLGEEVEVKVTAPVQEEKAVSVLQADVVDAGVTGK